MSAAAVCCRWLLLLAGCACCLLSGSPRGELGVSVGGLVVSGMTQGCIIMPDLHRAPTTPGPTRDLRVFPTSLSPGPVSSVRKEVVMAVT